MGRPWSVRNRVSQTLKATNQNQNTMKHTSGEWYFNALEWKIRSGDQGIICELIHGTKTDQEYEANGKLIASAPGQQEASILLYNLLRKLAQVVSKQDFDIIRPDWNKAMSAHEQAINKATQ